MKKLLFALLGAALMTISCGKQNPDDNNGGGDNLQPASATTVYTGTCSVTTGPSPSNLDGSVVEVTLGDKTLEIKFVKISFVPGKMPPMDIYMKEIPFTKDGDSGKIVFERDDFDPWCLEVEYPDYHVTGLTGSIDSGNIEFSLKFGAIPTSFAGAAQK